VAVAGSAGWSDGEYLTAGSHEVVRVAGMADLGQPLVEHAAHDCGGIAGSQLQPGIEPGLVVIVRVGRELDAQVPAAGELHHEHGLGHARVIHLGDGAAEHGPDAPPDLLTPLWLGEDVRVAPGPS
jgi:hypothetical protein